VLPIVDDHTLTGWFSRFWMRSVAGIGAAVVADTQARGLAVVVAIAGFAWATAAWLDRGASRATLTVRDRVITIDRHGQKTLRIALDDLDDVRLEARDEVVGLALQRDAHGVHGTTTGVREDSHLSWCPANTS
jgi:C-terminal processing protease CtpA/Prc